MQDIYSLKDELLYLQNFQGIIETYQEIAASRMQRVKDSVLHNRQYLDETRSIYHEVIHSYETYVKQLLENQEATELQKNGKQVTILLTSNTKLYGPIIRKIYITFFEYIQNNETDLVIVGKTGLQMFKESASNKTYEYFEIPDDIITPEALKSILTYITPYTEITVFHGQFEDILTQVTKKTPITPGTSEQVSSDDTDQVNYIFEPSINEVIVYFEKEILGSLFVQTVNESNLSKFTSRMVTLNTTSDNIKKKLAESRLQMNVIEHRATNRKQQDQLASLSLWTT